ncbi:nucleotidyltransferase family protein [Enterovirga aerilata]|uniref:DNA processing protein DprA n=1 Tax=Enterovirga aerilata TaxID=2730920 RepID=A0A849I1J0_9HYPH|nr:nucleotidyltransferase domain-containing protein [Enterovirga sp. DB1703]NNM71231.1 DNA processing protein DprA [Enterovirga sp. DB1703]
MRRDEAVSRLAGLEPELRAFGVAHLYLFGSVARDEAGPGSDLDVFVEPVGQDFFRLDNYMGPFELIERIFPGVPVGYSTRQGLSDYIRDTVESEAVRVF